ncbi:hypothetical protein BGW80DRAFT_1247083 [Lactifluus volemus]|nr:hypothetical protein BGW80DRAFT_1247083 [Lactifluus volemus]
MSLYVRSLPVRLAGFRLIEAGLVHMLQLASKTGATLADLGKCDLASNVLTSAAKFEENLRSVDDPQNIHRQSIAQATVVYHCSRMEAAWKEGNDSVAQYMLRNITGRLQVVLVPKATLNTWLIYPRVTYALPQFSPHVRRPEVSPFCHQRELLASKILEIGRSFLTGSTRENEKNIDARAEEGVNWTLRPQRSILKNLARAYVLSSSLNSENLARAETALNELLDSTPADNQRDVAHQEMLWWKLAVLKRRNAPEDTLFESLSLIIWNSQKTTSPSAPPSIFGPFKVFTNRPHTLPSVLLELRTLPHHQDADHDKAMRDLRETCSLLESAEFELPRIGATACLMLFYQYGERKRSLKRYSEAVEWFLLGTRRAFSSVADTCASKCFRKAAISHIEQEEYAQASAIIRQCPGEEAATHYLTFLVAVKQAIRAVRAMVHGSCFDQRMLLMATRLAHESDLKNVLLSVLQELLDLVRARKTTEMTVEPITLVRRSRECWGKHFATALVDAACKEKRVSLIIKDVSWLWRTAYNCATQGCADWDNAEEKVSPLFDMSRELLETYLETALEVDEEMYLCIVFSSFAATSARVFALRKLEPQTVNSDKLEFTAHEIQSCGERLRKTVEKGVISSSNIPRVTQCLGVLLIFETELACRMKEWQVIPKVIQCYLNRSRVNPPDYAQSSGLLRSAHWMAILHASLDRNALSVEKFARWLRAICTMLLARNTAPDRLKAIGTLSKP